MALDNWLLLAMKRIFLVAVLLSAAPLFAWNATDTTRLPEWLNPKITGINTLPPRSSAVVPFYNGNEKDCVLLNGTWKFHLVPSPKNRIADFTKTDYDDSQWLNLPVPSNWQMPMFTGRLKEYEPKDLDPTGQGRVVDDYPIYVNIPYPWPKTNAPRAPDRDCPTP